MTILEDEVAVGKDAHSFQKQFVDTFAEQKRVELYEKFLQTPYDDIDGMTEVKRMLYTLETFVNEIKSYITTGQMAKITIDENGEKNA